MTYSLNKRTKEFETKLAEQQRHMDWYAQECRTDVFPADTDHYEKEYYSLMWQRTKTQRLYAKYLCKQISHLKDKKHAQKQRNQLKKTYFQLQDSVQQARRTLLTLGPDIGAF